MKDKPTPSPWHIERTLTYCFVKAGATLIADVSSGQDADLIAAAPKMLEALEYSVQTLYSVTCNAIDPNEFENIRKQLDLYLRMIREIKDL